MRSASLFVSAALIVGVLVAAREGDRPDSTAIDAVVGTPGLVAFWTFGEAPGQPRESTGTRQPHALTEVGGPIARVEGGPFSGYSAELDGRQYFSIPHADTGDLNISGPDAQVSMFAVVRVVNLEQSRTIAGMWSEGKGAGDDTGTRQYALLMNMPTYGGPRQLTPHISSEGGVTRRADGSAFPWCADYAATRAEVPEGQWCSLGFTYDGRYIRAYINGVLDSRPLDPERDRRTDRYFTREGPGGGDRGMNPYYHGRGIFRYDPVVHATTKPGGGSDFTIGARYAVGKMLGEATIGRFGGLAVFNRGLTDEEMRRLHEAANVPTLQRMARGAKDLRPPGYAGTPFGDARGASAPQPIPGRVRCARYDAGGEGVAYHDTDAINNGSGRLNPLDGSYLHAFRKDEGVDTSYTKFRDAIDDTPYNLVRPEPDALYVGWTEPGEWFNITVDVKAAGRYGVALSYTSNKGGTIGLDLNGRAVAGPLTVPSTFDARDQIAWRQWHHWNRVERLATVELPEGTSVLTLRVLTNGNMNFESLEFVPE